MTINEITYGYRIPKKVENKNILSFELISKDNKEYTKVADGIDKC